MADRSNRRPRGLGTEEEQIKLGETIANRWTPTRDHGPKAEARFRNLIRAIIKSYRLAKANEIYWVLDNYVSIRCDPSWCNHLTKFVKEEYDKAIEEDIVILSFEEKVRIRERKRKAEWKKRQGNA